MESEFLITYYLRGKAKMFCFSVVVNGDATESVLLVVTLRMLVFVSGEIV